MPVGSAAVPHSITGHLETTGHGQLHCAVAISFVILGFCSGVHSLQLKLQAGKLHCYTAIAVVAWSVHTLCGRQDLWSASASTWHVRATCSLQTAQVSQTLWDSFNRVFTDLRLPDLPSLTERYEATVACFSSLG